MSFYRRPNCHALWFTSDGIIDTCYWQDLSQDEVDFSTVCREEFAPCIEPWRVYISRRGDMSGGGASFVFDAPSKEIAVIKLYQELGKHLAGDQVDSVERNNQVYMDDPSMICPSMHHTGDCK